MPVSANHKVPKTVRLASAVDEQREWMEKCGGDRAGYVENFHYRHGRTVENAEAIYEADLAQLRKAQERLDEARRRQRKR